MDKKEPEKDDGNIEYKLHLLHDNPDRISSLTTQLQYRLREGKGECFYEIGIKDNGEVCGITKSDMQESLNRLEQMAKDIDASIINVFKGVCGDKEVAQVLIRSNIQSDIIDIKIGIAGSVNAGKSSLLGVLTQGRLDYKGSARMSVFNFDHEIKSGNTSSISTQIIGYSNGKNSIIRNKSWIEIVSKSNKIITFFDLAGHSKYLKTTVSGICGNELDYACILVGASMDITEMTKEHINLCLIFKIPFIVLISKIDIAPLHKLKENLNKIKKMLKLPGVSKIPYTIKNKDDLRTCISMMNTNKNIIPLITFSNVTGENIDVIETMFNLLPSKSPFKNISSSDIFEMNISSVFSVKGIGTIIYGPILKGVVKKGSCILIGPDGNGMYKSCKVKSIQCKRVDVDFAKENQHVCLAVKFEYSINKRWIKKGMYAIFPFQPRIAVNSIISKICIFKSHYTTIKKGYEAVFHILSTSCIAKLVEIDADLPEKREYLRPGDRSIVKFKLTKPIYISTGDRFLFREGRPRGYGLVLKIET